MKELLWDLFKNTGKIEYYLKMKDVECNEKSSGRKEI